ncbi:hypothetical protein B0T18DRAFT_41915 [Schizothecium vesticola]|uniref:Uncharacterized protein n=1 Tax=Schizothecium vesticola TaxID=314040 RepID=A0AA40FC87_9PEZI|nr:hypothetical protein B0T18DRAFT_41915 [Schizothecium vesticola]
MRWRCLRKAGQLLLEVGGGSCSDVQAATVGWSRGSAPKRTTRSEWTGIGEAKSKPMAPNLMETGVARADGWAGGVDGGLGRGMASRSGVERPTATTTRTAVDGDEDGRSRRRRTGRNKVRRPWRLDTEQNGVEPVGLLTWRARQGKMEACGQ